jgi:hypothetical protein
MDWLDPPYQFFHPQPERSFELQVVRYEVGVARRPILDPPGFVDKPTIRFHLAKPIPPGLFLAIRSSGSAETAQVSPEALEARPYVDFTNAPLIQRILAIYDDLIARVRRQVPFPDLKQMERLSPKSSEAITLRLTRHGLRIDTRYDVEVVER